MEGKKKTVRSHKAQLTAMLQYMAEHPRFAAGEYTAAMGAQQHESKWLELKAILDELGPNRSVQQWKTSWRDEKRKARAAGAEYRRAVDRTGNGPVPELSEDAALILQTIGTEMAEGQGEEASPVGFSGTGQEQEPTAGPSSAGSCSAPPVRPARPAPAAPPSARRQKRRVLPSECFLKEQKKSNTILEDIQRTLQSIHSEMAESNRLKKMKMGLAEYSYVVTADDEEVADTSD